MSECDNQFSGLFWRKRIREDKKEEQGDQGPSPSQAGQSSPRGTVSAPLVPSFSGSEGRKESWRLQENRALRSPLAKGSKRELPRRAQPLRGFKLS